MYHKLSSSLLSSQIVVFLCVHGVINIDAKALGNLPPVLGWNTWCTQNKCGNDWCTEDEIISVGTAMKENGLLDAGYSYLNLDDCWGVRNEKTKRIEADPSRFPNGIKYLVSKIHNLGFKIGIYTDMGENGCHHPFTGSWPYYKQDANDFSEWGVDYVKFDYCDKPEGYLSSQLTENMSHALENTKTNNSIWLNFHCNWLTFEDKRCGVFGNSFRIAPDHIDSWYSTLKTSRELMNRKPWWGPNLDYNNNIKTGYPDPDFVFTGGQGCASHGKVNPPGKRCPGQADEEYRTEFSVNAIASGQILFASDPRNMSKIQQDILLNDEILSVFKDTSGLANVLQIHKQNDIIPSNPNNCNVTLTNQLSHGGCVLNVDFGCIADDNYKIWVANGCRAMFTCYGTPSINCESGGSTYPDHNNVTCTCNPPSSQIWLRKLKNKSQTAVLFVNAADITKDITVYFKEIILASSPIGKTEQSFLSIPPPSTAIVRDLWQKKNLGTFHESYTAFQMAPHSSKFLKFTLL
jgi:alpha-galactosidase